MTITPVIPDLYQIRIPTPFPVGPVNVYVAVSPNEPLTLIDTGPRTDRARAALERGLANLGATVADIGRIIITHAHSDHYGLAGDLAQNAENRVYSHPRNRPMLEDYPAEREKRGAFFGALLLEAGVPPDVQATMVQGLQGYRHFATAVSPIVDLDEGEEVWLSDQRWQVLFMPGHAGGLICLFQPEMGVFLSNDHLLRDVSSNPLFEPPLPGETRRRRSLVEYIRSLERTAAMEFAVAWPGHGEPIYDHRSLIESRLAFHRQRAEKLLEVLRDAPQTVFALSQALFPDLNTMDRFLAVSEVLAHLEWLEDQGKVRCEPQGQLGMWRKAS